MSLRHILNHPFLKAFSWELKKYFFNSQKNISKNDYLLCALRTHINKIHIYNQLSADMLWHIFIHIATCHVGWFDARHAFLVKSRSYIYIYIYNQLSPDMVWHIYSHSHLSCGHDVMLGMHFSWRDRKSVV